MFAKARWKETTWIFLSTRLAIFTVAAMALFIHSRLSPTAPGPTMLPHHVVEHWRTDDSLTYVLGWWRWDAKHYTRIAMYGYMVYQKYVVFFPLWPLLMSLVGHLIALLVPDEIAYYLAGVLLANTFFYGALLLFSWLVEQFYGRGVARWATVLLAIYPYTIFFVAGYTEALFLFLTLATFCFLQRGQRYDWLWASLCAMLVATTREAGFVIIVPFLVLLVQRFWPLRTKFWTQWRVLLALLLPLALIPLGVLCYMYYLYNLPLKAPLPHEGLLKALAFTKAATDWNRPSLFPGAAILIALRNMLTAPTSGAFGYVNMMDLGFTLLPLIALAVGWKHLPLSQSLFALGVMLFSLSTVNIGSEPLASMPRYLLVAFPIFTLYALWSKKQLWRRSALCLIYGLLLLYNIFLFVGNAWVA